MEQQFNTIDEVKDYIEFLQLKGKPIPNWVEAERQRLEQEADISSDEFIYGTMAANNKFMTPEKDKVVHEMADQLMSDAPNATQPCLLLGKVQCGKTDTFLSIMGLCFDRGIDIAVVMTKGTNTLTEQTLKRLNSEFRFFRDDNTYNQKVVIEIWDILKLYKRGGLSDYQLGDPRRKFIIVVKKENTNLTYLNDLFESNGQMRAKKVLVCDDEADFASRAYYQRKGELSLLRIAEHIEKFENLPKYIRYLQITATPYSLFLQPDGTIQLREGEEASPWLPRYTGLVPIHNRYVGGKQYYELSEDPNSMYSCLFQPVDPLCIQILSSRNEFYLQSKAHSENLRSLNMAVVSYLFSSAIRSIQVRNKENRKYKSSCLIHCEIAKKDHEWQADLIDGIIKDIKDAFVTRGNSDLHILDLESEAYESLKKSNELGNKYELISEKFPSFAEVEAEVKRILEYNDYTVNVVNSEEPGKVATMLNEKGQLRLETALNIFIGGSILDRGITIDNMLCFFYGRDPKKFQMDTVLQHARMYGARDKEDMACTRFFTTQEIYDVLKTINNIDDMMYEYLKHHRTSVQTDDFTSMVIGYDKRIKASAANKYTPANVKVVKPFQRILPRGFQTGDASEIADTVKEIDNLLVNVPGYKAANEENKKDKPFFLLDYETAVKIIHLISSTFRYGEQYNNVDYEWDENEMLTALDHCVFDTDGMVYCQVYTGRNMGRERENIYDKRGRFIDAPESGVINNRARAKATNRPVLTLLRQNGSSAQGWRDTPFWWPSLMLDRDMTVGMFTVNAKRKLRAPRKQLKMAALDNYPKEQVLKLTLKSDAFFGIIAGWQKQESRDIKETTCSLYLSKDEKGNFIGVPGLDPDKYYNLSSYNNGIFPFEIRKYKYIHFRLSQDMSGSQAIVELDDQYPYFLEPEQGKQTDIVYSSDNIGHDTEDNDVCRWTIIYNIKKVRETLLTPQDQEAFENFKNAPNNI